MVLAEIRLLRAAITLAEELNFSRAAERLRIDQSTLSKRILELRTPSRYATLRAQSSEGQRD